MAQGYEKYVICEGKVRKSAKGTFYTQDQIKELDKDYARIIPNGYVMFDVDNMLIGKLLLKILKDNTYHKPLRFNYVKSTKGYHFNFKTSYKIIPNINKTYNWLGLEIDIKGAGLDEKDKISYESMRVDGVQRVDVGWNGVEEISGGLNLDDLDIAPIWLYHLHSDIKNIKDEKSKLYTLGKVLYTEDMATRGIEDLLIGDRNGFYFGNYMIACKKYKFSYEEYLEAVNIVNLVADFKKFETKKEVRLGVEFEIDKWVSWGTRSLSKDEIDAASREEAWDGIVAREDDDITALLAIAEDLYLELCAIVDKNTDELKIIDYRPGAFNYYRNNKMVVEDILKTEYKGVKALTPGKEQDVIKFLTEIAIGRMDAEGNQISYRENDPDYYGTYKDRKLVRDGDRGDIELTREIYTGLMYNINNFKVKEGDEA